MGVFAESLLVWTALTGRGDTIYLTEKVAGQCYSR